jgi:hypothetical protein
VIAKLLGDARTRLDEHTDGTGAQSKRFKIAAEYMIGRTLDMRAAYANPKSGHYYGPHNIKEYIDKKIYVYMRDPQESTKPQWLKDLLRDVLTPLIQAIDSDWAGTEGDWAVQINVISSAEQSINRHTDKHDIAPQYGMALGDYEGGGLTVWTKDETSKQTIDVRNNVVRLDGRNYHQVEPVTEGTRYSIYFFKNYDRRWDTAKPHTDQSSIVYNGGRGSASGGGGASGGGDPPKPVAEPADQLTSKDGEMEEGTGKTYAQMQCPDWEPDPDRKKRAQKAEKPRAARKSPRTKRTVKRRTDRQLSGSTRVATIEEIDKDGPPGGVKDDEGPGMGWT